MITHPEKVLFPDSGITKGELCSYYEAIAPLMLPHIRGRPVTMERFPAGIDKKGFLQKDVSKGFPSWLERVEIAKRSGMPDETVHYPLANDARSLLWMANQNSITPHVWVSRVPMLERPDVCVFDLDPSQDQARPLRAAALAVRDLMDELGLPSFVKTSGSKGFHILVPVDREADLEAVWRFAHGAGAVLVKRHPDILTQEFIKADRDGRILPTAGDNWGYHGAVMAHAFAGAGDSILSPPMTSNPLLYADASQHRDGTVDVMLTNTSPTAALAVSVSVTGGGFALHCSGFRYGYTSAGANLDGPITTQNIFSAPQGTSFTVAVPAYSVVVLAFPNG